MTCVSLIALQGHPFGVDSHDCSAMNNKFRKHLLKLTSHVLTNDFDSNLNLHCYTHSVWLEIATSSVHRQSARDDGHTVDGWLAGCLPAWLASGWLAAGWLAGLLADR